MSNNVRLEPGDILEIDNICEEHLHTEFPQ